VKSVRGVVLDERLNTPIGGAVVLEARAMHTEIFPNRGAGALTFGMSKSDVRRVLGEPNKEFVRSQYSACVEWDYQSLGINVIFDRSGACAGVMFTRPSDPRLDGFSLLGTGAAKAWSAVRRRDAGAKVEDGSLTSTRLGVSVNAPDVEDAPKEPAYSVLVFRSDYFDLK
jgi:hypothetical protein